MARESALRLAFLGSPPFATPVFAAMVEAGFEIVGLVTSPPRRAGRGRKEVVNPLVELAQARGIPVLRPESARDAAFQQDFATWQADVGVVVSYGQLLDQALLDLPAQGCVNLHGSLLPRWRGASPVQAALLAGDQETGVSLQQMVLALDAGPVLAERATPIADREEAPELFARLADLGATLLVDFFRGVESGGGQLPPGKPQDESAVTVCRKVRKEQGVVDWSNSAAEMDRLVRAMASWPCAQTQLPNGDGLKIHRGHVVADFAEAASGTIVALEPALVIACGHGHFALDEVQREGKGRMVASDFLRGTSLAVGETLGA